MLRSQQPWAAWSVAGLILVWIQGREGGLSRQIGLTGKPRQLTASVRDPVVGSNPESDFAIICWEGKQSGETAILAQMVETPANGSRKSK